MQQRSWFRGSVLGAALASVAVACSSGDAPSPGLGSGGSSTGTAGANAAGANAAGAASTSAGTANTAGNANASAGMTNTAGSAAVGGGSNAAGNTSAGTATGGANTGGTGGAATAGANSAGTAGTNTAGSNTAGSNAAGTNAGGGGSGGTASGGSNSGPPTGDQLIAKLGSCTKVSGPYNPDGPNTGNINVCKTGNAVWWKADLDVDCDGIQTPPCDTDSTGQPQTSIVDLAPNGDVDPTKLPYFVIPLGTPETEWYTAYGIELGQIGAIIYQGQVIYGIFADQAGGNFIGEASYKLCSLFIGANNCDPNNGGIDPLDVTYITFTGTTPRASGQDIYDHAKHTALGEAAAKAWLAQ